MDLTYSLLMHKHLLFGLVAILFFSCGEAKQEEVRKKYIEIVLLDRAEPGHIQAIQEAIDSFYKVETIILDTLELPSMAFYKPRQRYKADSLLKFLKSSRPDTIDKVIGITTSDISTNTETHDDWGIFGLATIRGRSAVISSYRLRAGDASAEKIKERIVKVTLHELGHNFGLEHCRSGSKTCLMRDGEGKIKTVDEERIELCGICTRSLN